MSFSKSKPETNIQLRSDIYNGDCYQLSATDASTQLVDATWQLLHEQFGADPRMAQFELEDSQYFKKVGVIRRTMFLEQNWHEMIRKVIADCGFDPARIAFDPPRLRTIRSGGHHNPRAKAIYYPHRDTWYAHPAGIIVCWIPLHDCKQQETFVYHPDKLNTPVPNDSEIFDYDQWVEKDWDKKIGWQNRNAGLTAKYPGVLGKIETKVNAGFSAKRAENILFAGAHLHTTLPQETGRTRFSLDFRLVHLDDHTAGLAAPSVDNRSKGSALRDYIMPITASK